jgi:hypothetical protein
MAIIRDYKKGVSDYVNHRGANCIYKSKALEHGYANNVKAEASQLQGLKYYYSNNCNTICQAVYRFGEKYNKKHLNKKHYKIIFNKHNLLFNYFYSKKIN